MWHTFRMAGTSTLTKHFGLRIPMDLWGRLQAIAASRQMSVSAVLLEPWEKPTPKIGRPSTKPTALPTAPVGSLMKVKP